MKWQSRHTERSKRLNEPSGQETASSGNTCRQVLEDKTVVHDLGLLRSDFFSSWS